MRQLDSSPRIRPGSFAWRGAAGGALGMVAVIFYICYEAPYNLAAGPYLLLLVLIGGINGMMVGGLIGMGNQLVAKPFGVILRIVFGTLLTCLLIGAYFDWHEGIGADLKRFLVNVLLLGLLIGGLAGATAGARSGKSRAAL